MPFPNLDAVAAQFDENFASRGEAGAAVSVWCNGREILSLARGRMDREGTREWTAGTPVLLWSAGKAPGAMCVLQALCRVGIELNAPVASLWPEFAQAGKERVTFSQVLSHQAGLAALDDRTATVLDHSAVARALAAQAPNWTPGEDHGYHPRTFGFLLDEILRRAQPGWTLGQWWRSHWAGLLGLDLWIGMPDALHGRVATTFPAKQPASSQPEPAALYRALAEEDSLTRRAFASPAGLHSVAQMMKPEARRAELSAFGAIGTAGALAGFYDALITGRAPLPTETVAQLSEPLTSGMDHVLQAPTAFSLGVMLDPVERAEVGATAGRRKQRAIFGPSLRAFGQPGAGGVHAFADPENGVSFGYVMNQMELGVFPNQRALSMVEALYS